LLQQEYISHLNAAIKCSGEEINIGQVRSYKLL